MGERTREREEKARQRKTGIQGARPRDAFSHRPILGAHGFGAGVSLSRTKSAIEIGPPSQVRGRRAFGVECVCALNDNYAGGDAIEIGDRETECAGNRVIANRDR